MQATQKPTQQDESEIDLSAVELDVEFVLSEIEARASEWVHTIAKLKDASKRDANGVLFQLLYLMRGLGFAAQDLLTVQGKERSAGSLESMLAMLQSAFDKELQTVMPVESIEE